MERKVGNGFRTLVGGWGGFLNIKIIKWEENKVGL